MRAEPNQPMGCLAFLFGFTGSKTAGHIKLPDPNGGQEGNYHSGPGGYEGGGYTGGHVASYRPEQPYFDGSESFEADEH